MKQWIGLQTFIVEMLIISYMEDCPIYIKRKEGARRLAARETERECVCVRDGEWLKIELASVVKMSIGERLTILG